MDTTATFSGRRSIVALWAALLFLAALAWAWTVGLYSAMAGTSRAGMMMAPGFPVILAMWMVMMPAMMLPSVAPVATAYLRTLGTRTAGPVRVGRIAGFLFGYLLAWGVFSVLAAIAQAGLGRLGGEFPWILRWTPAIGLLLAGLFQFTRLKDACLRQCRTPFAFLLQVGSYRGTTRDLRAGVHHGSYCIGCCLGLMGLLVVLGSVTLLLMGVMTTVVVLEKTWPHGRTLARAVGVTFIALVPIVLWV